MRNTIQGWYSVLYQASNWCVRYTNSGFCHMCRQLEIQYLSKTSFIDTYKKASRLTFVMLQLDIKETFLKCNCNFSCRPNIETRCKNFVQFILLLPNLFVFEKWNEQVWSAKKKISTLIFLIRLISEERFLSICSRHRPPLDV